MITLSFRDYIENFSKKKHSLDDNWVMTKAAIDGTLIRYNWFHKDGREISGFAFLDEI